jgi:hypothetical protein
MDVAWQDGAGSFLDWSGSDLSGSFASLASGNGGVLWSSAGDTPAFSGDSVLWESSADAPAASHLSAFDPSATETDGTPTSSWITSGTSGLLVGSSSLDNGLLWAGAGDAASSSPLTNAGVAQFDLAAGSGVPSQWQQLLDVSANQEGRFQQATHLLWAGGSDQPALAPPIMPDSLHLTGGLAQPAFPTLAPEHLAWTDPSAATGLLAAQSFGDVHAADPSRLDAAPTTLASGLGGPVQPSTGLPTGLGGTG